MAAPKRRMKDAMEMEAGDWFCTRFGARLVTWAAQEAPVFHGGAVGWAVRAYPLEDPEGRPWPEGLSRDIQHVRLDDVEVMLEPATPGGVA